MRRQRSHHTVASHAALHGDMLRSYCPLCGLRGTLCMHPATQDSSSPLRACGGFLYHPYVLVLRGHETGTHLKPKTHIVDRFMITSTTKQSVFSLNIGSLSASHHVF